MSGKSFIGSVLISIIGSVIVVGLIGYFLLPVFIPDPEIGPDPVIVQSNYQEWDSEAYIWDDDITNYLKMNDTEMDITIAQDSKIAITFFATALLSLQPTFNGKNSYTISLVIEGISNRTFMVGYYDDSGATGSFRQLTFNIYSHYLSESLPAGTYTCAVYWISDFDAAGLNSLSVNHVPTWNYTRSMLLQEII